MTPPHQPRSGVQAQEDQVMSSVALTLSSTRSDIVGTQRSFTAPVGGKLLVSATFDINYGTANDVLGGGLVVDGGNVAGKVIMQRSVTGRVFATRSWVVQVAAGTHSMQLQAWIGSGSGTNHTTVIDNTGYTWQFTPGAK